MRILEALFSIIMEPTNCSAFIGDLEASFKTIRRQSKIKAAHWLAKQVIFSFWPLLKAVLHRRVLKSLPRQTLSTGFIKFDAMTGGLNDGDLFILAAPPSVGKTALALNIAQHVAMHPDRKPVAIFSLAMSSSSLLTRLLCSCARVDQHKFHAGFLNQEERRRLQAALADLTEAPFYIDDTTEVTLKDIRSKLRQLMARQDIALVVIDYLQLMSSRVENRNQEVSAICRGLKLMAKDLNVPFIVLSQLSRASETRQGDHKPMLSDLRDSGLVEQDADLVGFIFREEIYKRDDESVKGLADLIIAKQRNGPIGNVPLRFIGQYTRFENRAEDLPPEE